MPVSNITALTARRATLHAKPKVPAGWRQVSKEDVYLMLLPHSALSDFIGQRAGKWHWDTLIFRLKTALWAARMYIPHEKDVGETLEAAVGYLTIAKERAEETQVWRLPGPGERIVGDGLHYADQLQQVCTRLQLAEATKRCVRAHARNIEDIGMTQEQASRWLRKL